MQDLEQILARIRALEARAERTVQTTTYWARTTEAVDGAEDPLIGVETEVEPIINDREEDDSHKIGIYSEGKYPVIHRGANPIGEAEIVLVEVTSLGHAIIPSPAGAQILEWDDAIVDCDGESPTGYYYVEYSGYSGGCGEPPGIVEDPYSDYFGRVEVRPPKCGGPPEDELKEMGGGWAYFIFPKDDCGNGFWRAADVCVSGDCP